MVGAFLVAVQPTLASLGPITQQTTVTAVVEARAPTVGATITNPIDGTTLKDKRITVNGTCFADSFVVVFSNSQPIGSTTCTGAGIFTVVAELFNGKNILSARNYDALNQAGPDTPSITVTLSSAVTNSLSLLTLPDNLFYIPALHNDPHRCKNVAPPVIPDTKSGIRILIICIPRTLEKNTTYTMGWLIYGGKPPYAVNINWGDTGQPDTLLSIEQAGYTPTEFSYETSGIKTIRLTVTDSEGQSGYVETSVQVNGQESTIINDIRQSLFTTSWFETPVPLYVLAVAITLGFWAGDIFDRRFGARRVVSRRTRRA